MKFKFFFFLLFVGSYVHAQEYNQLPQVILPSPNTREFDKYIKYNVSLQNGLPDISIPLYEIVVKGLTIPVTLNYHASGIKHRQNSGEVGLGWVINPRYRVSKTVYGLEDGNMPSTILDPSSAFGTAKARDFYLTQFYGGPNTGFPSAANSYDGEYDIYNYSMASASGTFIEKDVVNHKFELLDTRNVDIIKKFSGNAYYFDLRDENGIAYRMGSPNGAMETYGGGFSPVSGLAWMVTQIKTPSDGVINFEYVVKNVFEQTPDLIHSTVRDGIGQQLGGACLPTHESVSYPQYSNYSTSFVKKITTEFEVIEFFHHSVGELLEKIEVRDKSNGLKRKIVFTYRNSNAYTFLDAVSITSSNESSPQVYSLQYYTEVGAINVQTFDNWGYIYYPYTNFYSGYVLPRDLANVQVKNFTDCTTDTPGQIGVSSYLASYTFFDKIVSQDPIDYSLKRITYPTGGFTEYEYESHQHVFSSGEAKKGAGLRVKKISNNDGINGKTIIREFTYGTNEVGYGRSRIDLGSEDFVTEGIWSARGFYDAADPNGWNVGLNAIETQFEFSNKASNEVLVHNAAIVYYPEVNEYTKDASGNILGKTQYLYNIPGNWYGAYGRFGTNSSYSCYPFLTPGAFTVLKNRRFFPRYIQRDSPWAKAYLIESNVFGYSDNTFNLVKKEQIFYDEIVRNTFMGLKVRPFLIGATVNYTDDSYGLGAYDNLVESVFDYAKYYVESGTILPRKKTITDYSSQGNIVVNQLYYYNENDQLTKEEIDDSRSGITLQEHKYPSDYKNLTANDGLTMGIRNLQAMNILGPKIEMTVWKKTNDLKSLVSAQLKSFKPSAPWLELMMGIDNDKLLTDFSPTHVQNGSIIKDYRYKDKIFIKSDLKGNVLEQYRANGPKESYLWGYNNYYPIAAVKNAAENEFHYEGFEGSPVYQNLVLDNSRAHTGKYSGRISNSGSGEVTSHGGPRTQIGLTSPKKFTYSGWIYSDGPAAQIFLFMMRAGEPGYFSYADNVNSNTIGKWVYVQKEVMVPGDVAEVYLRLDNDGGGNVWFDDLRIYPSEGEMKTYTYEPLVGMTSEMDTKGQTIYYEYDSFHRLKYSRDQNRNIIKSFDYHFKP